MRSRSPWVLPVLVFLLACEPTFMFPGGELSGEVSAVPTDWAFADSVDTVQLETRPEDPYSVNIWGLGLGDRFYVASGGDSTWAGHIDENPDVRLRIGKAIYPLRAVRVEDQSTYAAFKEAVEEKYEREITEEQMAEGRLFRLDPR